MRCFCGVIVLLTTASAFGQVYYEPVQYHYGGQNRYFYGGADPRVHEGAQRPAAHGWGRGNGFDFRSGGIHTHREVSRQRPRIFTDALPWRNAFDFGFTANDARNQAMHNVPLYFSKRQMLAAALPDGRGGAIVPAQWDKFAPAGTVVIKPSVRRSALRERPVIVFPKDLLDRKLWGDKDRVLSRAM